MSLYSQPDMSDISNGWCTGSKMKRYLIPILVILVLALPLGGCQTTGTTETQVDTPTFRNDEVCALVYNYLEERTTSVSAISAPAIRRRMNLLDQLGKARPYFKAVYQGNGKWQVSAIGCGVKVNSVRPNSPLVSSAGSPPSTLICRRAGAGRPSG